MESGIIRVESPLVADIRGSDRVSWAIGGCNLLDRQLYSKPRFVVANHDLWFN